MIDIGNIYLNYNSALKRAKTKNYYGQVVNISNYLISVKLHKNNQLIEFQSPAEGCLIKLLLIPKVAQDYW